MHLWLWSYQPKHPKVPCIPGLILSKQYLDLHPDHRRNTVEQMEIGEQWVSKRHFCCSTAKQLRPLRGNWISETPQANVTQTHNSCVWKLFLRNKQSHGDQSASVWWQRKATGANWATLSGERRPNWGQNYMPYRPRWGNAERGGLNDTMGKKTTRFLKIKGQGQASCVCVALSSLK